MEKFIIEGGKRLFGEVTVSGAKNAAVAIIPATLLVEGKCLIENLPSIKDVKILLEMLTELGVTIDVIDDTTVNIDASYIATHKTPISLAKKMRASYYLLGALLGRMSKAEVAMPGGCNFGTRPIDQHIKGFEALGAFIVNEGDMVTARCHELVGTQIYLDVVSVGATINVMLAAVKAKGVTVIENAAKEPHIVDVANFLNSMGADIKGAGTDVIKINGVSKLTGGSYSIIPDQIEAGTFMVAAAATKGDVVINNVIPRHLEAITAKLIEMGVTVEEYDDSVRVKRTGELSKANIKTLPYPGFPTDMQPQMVALLSTVKGTSVVTESVWDSRFKYTHELAKMGADIAVKGQIATINGVDVLKGCSVTATDLRAGAGMVIAALIAEGTTEIEDIIHIDRGYECIEDKFNALGAEIYRR